VEYPQRLEEYPRTVVPGFKPFDPVKLARITEQIVCRCQDDECERKYDAIYVAGVYGGIATGYAVGCCLRCVFCWSYPSRDYPERYGRYYSPSEVFQRLKAVAKEAGVRKCRLSSCEPTICRKHLIALLEHVEDDPYFRLFILETNGVLFGEDKSYVAEISRFSKVYVRVSLKAGTPEEFTRKTGAIPEAFDLPFKAIKHLMEYDVPFHVAAMSLDPRIMSTEERAKLFERLASIDFRLLLRLEEEVMDPYRMTKIRLEAAGISVEWPLRRTYVPIREILIKRLKEGRRMNF